MNPLLEKSTLRHQAIPYDKIKGEHFLPALRKAIELAEACIESIKSLEPSFKNTIVGLETAADHVGYVSGIFYGLYSAHCTSEIESISEEFNSILTRYDNNVSLDKILFEKVKFVKDNSPSSLNSEDHMLLEKTYKSFIRNGALLSDSDKEDIRCIDKEMSSLDIKFTENVRKSINAFELVIENEKDLKGLPASSVESAKKLAIEKNKRDSWIFTLDVPSRLPFMQNCENRDLRKKMYVASSTIALGGEFDNEQNVKRMLELKFKRARLLGYKNHSEFILEERMAKNPETVFRFLKQFEEKSKAASEKEFQKLSRLKEELTGEDSFERHDASFYCEVLKKKELDIDDEVLRPYLELQNVIDGVFEIAEKLYDIKFKEVSDLPKFHTEVRVYEVYSMDNSFIGLFYADFHPRKEKRPGAWMNDIVAQGLSFGEISHPHIHITCNFTKPTDTKPSLLTLDEVETLFHEFGHGLHGLLSKCTYKSIAGTNVLWDFVELPSQIMENWVKEKECLDLFAKHYETGDMIPSEYIEKIKLSGQFLEGLGTMRQTSFGALDMELHNTDPKEISDLIEFENSILEKFDSYKKDNTKSMLCSFGHIFPHGGYSSGYYSYKWAEVLDADAFEAFKEKGIFSKEVALSFKENILEKGGSQHPMQLYKNFRGQEPSIEPLLRRAGLL